MPLLSYSAITDFPFQPFATIYSADMNAMFNSVKTLLNTTRLDYLNVQVHGLTRQGSSSNIAAGTANHVVINDSNGDFSSEATLATSRGGLGANLTPSSPLQAGQAIVVNAAGDGFALSSNSNSAVAVFSYNNFY